ncbi:MAG: hypothetical protein ACXWUR_09595 [Allosphingosinicella sp.]
MTFTTPNLEILVALVAGAWLAVAMIATWRARRLAASAREVLDENARLGALLAAGPASPMLVARDGTLHGHDRIAAAVGMETMPIYWQAFIDQATLDGEQAAALARGVAEAATGSAFSLPLRPSESGRVYRVEGGPAPSDFPERTVLVWFHDVTEIEEQATALRARLERRSAALEALTRLLELAPFPMWHRGPDLALSMVNSA